MALFANTLIPTPTAWVPLSQLTKDDIVFDNMGTPTTINSLQHYTPSECYEIEFDDGLTVQGDKHMTFLLQDRIWRNCLGRYKNYKTDKKKRKFRRPLIEKPITDISPIRIGTRLNYSVPNCLPVQYSSRDLPVPPYVFGVWFASLTPAGRHSAVSKPMNKMQKIFRNYGYFIKTKKHRNGRPIFDIRPSVRESFLFAGLNIPTSLPFYYLDADVGQRQELLEAFIDCGFVKKRKKSDVFTAKDSDYKLMRKIQGLVESLGAKTTLHGPKDSSSYTLEFRINPDFSVLYGTNRRFVVNVREIPPQPCVHIETGGHFLVGEGFIPVC